MGLKEPPTMKPCPCGRDPHVKTDLGDRCLGCAEAVVSGTSLTLVPLVRRTTSGHDHVHVGTAVGPYDLTDLFPPYPSV